MAVRRSRHVGGVSKRLTTWLSFDIGSNTIATEVGVVVASLNAAALALRPFTVVRTHLEMFMFSDQAAAFEAQEAAFGLAIVSDQAVAVGLAALPTPGTDMSSGLWFAHQVMLGDASNVANGPLGGAHYSIDSKAMRKVELGQDLVVMLENTSTSGIVVKSGGRILIKNN